MEKTDHRQSNRIGRSKNLKLLTDSSESKGGLSLSLTSVNVSESGLLFESSKAYQIGQQYTIRFTGNDNKLYDIRIEIIRVEEIVTHTQYNIGAKFMDTDADKIQLLLQ